VARQVDYLDFTPDALEPVLERMRAIDRARDGWVNVRPRPLVDPDPDEERITEFAATPLDAPVGLFARWRLVTIEGTWVPGKAGRNGPEDASVGLSHPAGRFAVRQLRDAGVAVPDGWRVVVDHARRGLVLAIPEALDADRDHGNGSVAVILAWLVAAGAVLGPQQMTGRWRAEIHRR
jgi:hypothetical protein